MFDRIRARLSPFLHALLSLRDRVLHPVRRRQAERTLREIASVRSILFLCTGNICRSPYAEKAFRGMLAAGGGAEDNGKPTLISGGFLRSGRASPEAAIRIAGERGIALDAHLSRTVEAAMLEGVSLVIVMERQHIRRLAPQRKEVAAPILLLGDLDPELPLRREIRDPWGQADEVFRESFERIDRCLRVLASRTASAMSAELSPRPDS